jgi:hypothetical protein
MRRLDPPGGAQACELMRALYPVRLTINVKCTLWLQRHPHLPGGEARTTGITDRYREMTSTFFAKLANSLGAKQRPAIVPLSESLGPPGPQTCHSTSSRISSSDQIPMSSHPTFTVFKFPEELILSVLDCVSPHPGPTVHYAWFRYQYNTYHRERVRFLLPLSMTCRAMRLRLLPWIWECVKVICRSDTEDFRRRPMVIMGTLCADPYLGTSVKYFHLLLCPWVRADLRPPKVPDNLAFIDQVHDSFVRQLPGVPFKSPHARDTMCGQRHCKPAQERP